MAIRKFSKPPGSVPVVLEADSFVSERLGFVYHCIPKTLSRSMLAFLATVDPDGYRICKKGVRVEILRGTDGTNAPTSFTFARNPYSRVVAFYYDKFVNYFGAPGQRALFARFDGLRPDMRFSEFVEWLATSEGNDERADPHFLSQHYFLLDVTGQPAVDYLGTVENIQEDIPELQRLLGFGREPFPHLNSNATREGVKFDTSQRWLEVLDNRSKRIIANRYDGDFELLGYPRLPYDPIPLFSRGAGGGRREPKGENGAKGSQLRRVRVVVNRLLAPLGFELRRTRKQSRRANRNVPTKSTTLETSVGVRLDASDRASTTT